MIGQIDAGALNRLFARCVDEGRLLSELHQVVDFHEGLNGSILARSPRESALWPRPALCVGLFRTGRLGVDGTVWSIARASGVVVVRKHQVVGACGHFPVQSVAG